MNNYLVDEPIEIRLLCENGTARLSYDEAVIHYADQRVEAVKNQPQKIVSYTGGKPYWGSQHAVQIDQFYRALAGEDYSQGALYFMYRGGSQSNYVNWFDGQLTPVLVHERHEFFK